MNPLPIKSRPITSRPFESDESEQIWPKLINPKLILPMRRLCMPQNSRPSFCRYGRDVHLVATQPEVLWPKQNGGAGMLRRLSCKLLPNNATAI
jgi:hypothetical protein